MTAPLSAIKVIEIGTLIAAPFAARMLTEFGAIGEAMGGIRYTGFAASAGWCQPRRLAGFAARSDRRIDVVAAGQDRAGRRANRHLFGGRHCCRPSQP